MENQIAQPRRCPACNALVVDRRSATCTTCDAELPKEWVMTKDQAAKVNQLDAQARTLHVQEMNKLDPFNDPNLPPVVRWLDSNVGGGMP
jgi:hypothetical protein